MNGDTNSIWGNLTNLISGAGQAVGSAAAGLRGNPSASQLVSNANANAPSASGTNWTPYLIGAAIIALGLVLIGVLGRGRG